MMKTFMTVADCDISLVEEWDVEANLGLLPSEVSALSNMKAYWRLPSGELFQEKVLLRTKRVMYGNNGFPSHLLLEFNEAKNHPFRLCDFKPNSNKRVWWICSNGHSYQSIIKNRTKGSNCPFCSGKKVNSQNCLASVHPTLAAEWHPINNGNLLPSQVTPSSSKQIWWECCEGHVWSASINNRKGGRNCPLCSKRNKFHVKE